METINNLATAASKLVFGDPSAASKTEPPLGQTGQGSAEDPHDSGNAPGRIYIVQCSHLQSDAARTTSRRKLMNCTITENTPDQAAESEKLEKFATAKAAQELPPAKSESLEREQSLLPTSNPDSSEDRHGPSSAEEKEANRPAEMPSENEQKEAVKPDKPAEEGTASDPKESETDGAPNNLTGSQFGKVNDADALGERHGSLPSEAPPSEEKGTPSASNGLPSAGQETPPVEKKAEEEEKPIDEKGALSEVKESPSGDREALSEPKDTHLRRTMSSGVAADGGDFDAAKPGAGEEADRMTTAPFPSILKYPSRSRSHPSYQLLTAATVISRTHA